jgi:hypothetical protein
VPVPVLLDDGLAGPRPWGAHWALALEVGPGHVRLGNGPPGPMPLAAFLRAWRCRHLPFTHHHCAVLARARRAG